MASEEKQFYNRQNLYYEVGFLSALQQWKKERNISFMRIFKESYKVAGLWPEDMEVSREEVLHHVLSYMQVSMAMQSLCYTHEIIKNSGLDQGNNDLKKKLNEIKTKCDIDGTEKTTNALQMLKIIREAFAHNNDHATIANWDMGYDCKVTIQSEIKKTGKRHNINFALRDLVEFTHVCLSSLADVDKNAIELDVNGIKLAKLFDKGNVLPVQVAKRIKQYNLHTQEKIEINERQLNALCNCLSGEFFHNEDTRSKLASPFRPDFICRIFPYDFNGYNHIADLKLVSDTLYHLERNYQSYDKWFDPIVKAVAKDENSTCEKMTYLFYVFLTGKYDSIIISNILFSIFSFESMDRLEDILSSANIDVNRVRNSVMHGRFYYNYNNAFDFYDGRSNAELEYVGTLTVRQITLVAQELMHEYIDDLRRNIINNIENI